MQSYYVWQNAWKPDYSNPVKITLPDSWQTEFYSMPADACPPLTQSEMRWVLSHPVGGPCLTDLAAGARNTVILFDDMTRPTPAGDWATLILEILLNAGVPQSSIRFLCATGTHAGLGRKDFVQKLGADIVSSYPVFNHNPFFGMEWLGESDQKYPVGLNREFMNCELKISIGMCAPHPHNGFGGGPKILFPGIAAYETTLAHHQKEDRGTPGSLKECSFRSSIEKMSASVDSLFSVNCVMNSHLDVIGAFAGTAKDVYYKAAEMSARVNRMPLPGGPKDVMICNVNAKNSEVAVSIRAAEKFLKPGGTLIVVNFAENGQVVHYSSGPFGLTQGGPRWVPHKDRVPPKYDRLIYFSPFEDYSARYFFAAPERVEFARSWEQVLEKTAAYRDYTACGILPDGSIGYFPA